MRDVPRQDATVAFYRKIQTTNVSWQDSLAVCADLDQQDSKKCVIMLIDRFLSYCRCPGGQGTSRWRKGEAALLP